MIKKFMKKYVDKLKIQICEKEDNLKFICGKQLCFAQKAMNANKLSDIQFKVFSQWGEDGIIEYLVDKLPIKNKFFIEFGVENYNESNTRFLMMNRNWGGMVIDASVDNIEYIKKRAYFWKYDLTPIVAFITRENINSLISSSLTKLNIEKDIGILSLDIDGMDYWVLKEITCIDPTIVICEYNSIFGNNQALSVPYSKSFMRSEAHYSNLYFGANLKAFDYLLSKRGYLYIGSNQENTNAFFVKKEPAEKYLKGLVENISDFEASKLRESRDKNGNLNLLRGKNRLEEIKELDLVDVISNRVISIKEII